MKPFNSLAVLLGATALVASGIGIGWQLALQQIPPASPEQMPASPEPVKPAQKVLYWYDPMMPQQHFDKPGKSPFMDMALIPKYAETTHTNGISIDPLRTENIGMRLATVSRLAVARQLEVSGLIGFNDRDVAVVQTRSPGFVERVWPLAAGDLVNAGQPLVELLLPEWASAQQELLAVRELGEPDLLTAARQRLRLLGMPDNLIQHLELSGVVEYRYTITAPISGVIQSLDVRNGMSVMNAQTLVRINGLNKVWLEAAVAEAQAETLSIGDLAEVHLTAYPEQGMTGKISTILPMLHENSRSVRVRIELDNQQHKLRPGMSAQIRLSSHGADTGLAVPSEALIRTGKRTLVMLADDAGRYTPQEVHIGHEVGNFTVISAGLEEGQQVVASGQFLLDSEASLSGITAEPAHQQHQHQMEENP